MRRRAAFTFIELIVAMAVALIMGGVAYATYTGIAARSRDNAVIAFADEYAQNMSHYMALNGGTLPSSMQGTTGCSAGNLGTLAEVTCTGGKYSMLTYVPPTLDSFQIEFKAIGGTGTVYCRDMTGLGTLSSWSNTGPWAGCP